jgi:hypothetical protein
LGPFDTLGLCVVDLVQAFAVRAFFLILFTVGIEETEVYRLDVEIIEQ